MRFELDLIRGNVPAEPDSSFRARACKPLVVLRIVGAEQHAEEMAAELAQLVRGALDERLGVVVGKYQLAA